VTPVSRKEVTIGVDIGTTAVKAVAADADGRVVARTRIPHELRVPAPDRLEHNADEAWRQGPLAAVTELARPDALAIAVSAMVPSVTAVDSDGRPVTPGLLYGDGRGRAAGPHSTAADGPFPVGEAAEFVRWTAARAPDAAGYWPAPAVANYALGGEAVVDFPTAYTVAPLFDATGWNAEACAQHGATAGQMPRVDAPGAAAGEVGNSVLAVGAIDALCEQMVSGADDVGDVLVLCGTTLIVWVTIPEARQVPGLWTIPTMTGKSQIGGASNAGGLFLGWVDRILGPGDPDAADPHRVPVWSPYLRGERTPFHDPDRRGMLDGLELGHDASALRRAAYEAAGFVVRQLIELSGANVARIVAAGGGTRVQPWMQAIADATGRPVQVSGVAEGAALGAAFLGRMAVGKESTITDAARWAWIARAVEPQPAWAEPVAQRYRRFLELAASLT
jgi:xylulokinase